jgi:hypothetical protein
MRIPERGGLKVDVIHNMTFETKPVESLFGNKSGKISG